MKRVGQRNFGNTNNPRIAKISDSIQQNFWYLRRYLAERRMIYRKINIPKRTGES